MGSLLLVGVTSMSGASAAGHRTEWQRIDGHVVTAQAIWSDCPSGTPTVTGLHCRTTVVFAAGAPEMPGGSEVFVRSANQESRWVTETRQYPIGYICDDDGNCTMQWATETVTELRWVDVTWVQASGPGSALGAPRASVKASLISALACGIDSGCIPREPMALSVDWTPITGSGAVASPVSTRDPDMDDWQYYYDWDTGAVAGIWRPVHYGTWTQYDTSASGSIDGTSISEPEAVASTMRATGGSLCLASSLPALEECAMQ